MTTVLVAVTPPVGVRFKPMAHYKRGKSRVQSSPHRSRRAENNIYTHRQGRWWRFSGSWPRWHDILYHSRPRRRWDKKAERDLITDRVDADLATWAIEKKPHKYYW